MLQSLCPDGCFSLAETAIRAETLQRQDTTKKNIFNGTNLVLILQGMSGVIKFEFKAT